MFLGLGLQLGSRQTGVGIGLRITTPANGVAEIGTHASIGFTVADGVTATSPQWGSDRGLSDYGTGNSPTAFAEGRLWLRVTVDGEAYDTSLPAVHPVPVAAGALPDVFITFGDTDPIATSGDFTFAGSTLVYSLTAAPVGATINASTGEIGVSGVSVGDGQSIVVRAADALAGSRFAESGFSLNVADVPVAQNTTLTFADNGNGSILIGSAPSNVPLQSFTDTGSGGIAVAEQ